MFEWKLKAQNIFLDENTGGKGRYFKARILQPGLVKYSFGVCLLEKETIDKFVNDFVGCPVIIGHQDVTNQNADKLSRGNICHVWYDDKDGWYWVDGIIDNQEALNKIDEGYSVSCQYEITEYSNNMDNKLHNGNPYDKVILNGKPEHLAIVETPRYESAMIAVNAIDMTEETMEAENAKGFGGEEGDWITVNGVHIFVKKGQSKEDAVKDFIEKKQGGSSKEKQEEKTKVYTEDNYDEFHKKFYKEHDDKWTLQRTTKGYDVHRTNEQKKWEFNQDLKKEDLSDYLTNEVIKLRLPNIQKKNKEGKSEFFEDEKRLQFFKDNGYEPSDKYDDGYYTNFILKKKEQSTEPKQEGKKDIKDIVDELSDPKADKDFSGVAKDKTVKEQKLEGGIKETKDKYGRTNFTKGNKWANVMKNGNYYFAAYGLTHKTGVSWEDEKGVTHDQLLHGKGFKTEKGARKWALEQLKRITADNSISETITKAINELKDTDMFKSLFRKKEQEMNKDEMKQIFAECLQEVLIARNEEDEEKEKAAENEDEELEEELKVEEKAKNKKCKNEEVDKREIIRQIMAIAGKEEASEDVKTIAKLAEKLAYDKSEADTADNGKKAKCEDDEEDEDKKEEAKNKAKNAIDDMKGLFASAGVNKAPSKYVTQSDAIELGNQLF